MWPLCHVLAHQGDWRLCVIPVGRSKLRYTYSSSSCCCLPEATQHLHTKLHVDVDLIESESKKQEARSKKQEARSKKKQRKIHTRRFVSSCCFAFLFAFLVSCVVLCCVTPTVQSVCSVSKPCFHLFVVLGSAGERGKHIKRAKRASLHLQPLRQSSQCSRPGTQGKQGPCCRGRRQCT